MVFKSFKYPIILLFACLFLNSCTVSKSIVYDSSSIDLYEYAIVDEIVNYSGTESMMDLEARIFNTLESSKLTMIGANRLSELSDKQKELLLIIKIAATSNNDESVVNVSFLDYMSGKPIVTCRGADQMGFGRQGRMNWAIDKVIEQIKQVWVHKKY